MLRRVSRQEGLTVLHVTHDRAEAFALADTCAVLVDGQSAADRPAAGRAAAAGRRGGGALPRRSQRAARGARRVAIRVVAHLGAGVSLRAAEPLPAATVDLIVRPEDVEVWPAGAAPADSRQPRPRRTVVRLVLQGGHVLVGAEGPMPLEALVTARRADDLRLARRCRGRAHGRSGVRARHPGNVSGRLPNAVTGMSRATGRPERRRDAKEAAMALSARNQLPGTVKSVVLGTVMAEVVVDVAGHEVVSVITRHSVGVAGHQGRRQRQGRDQVHRGHAARSDAGAGRYTGPLRTRRPPSRTRERHPRQGAGQGRLPASLDHRPLQPALHVLHACRGRAGALARRHPQLRGAGGVRSRGRRLRHQQGAHHRRRTARASAAAPTSSACSAAPAASTTSR